MRLKSSPPCQETGQRICKHSLPLKSSSVILRVSFMNSAELQPCCTIVFRMAAALAAFASQALCINQSLPSAGPWALISLRKCTHRGESSFTRAAHLARSKIDLLRKSQQFQGKQLPAKSFNDRRGNESLALQVPPALLFVPSSTGDARGADPRFPSLECGVRSLWECQEPGNVQPVAGICPNPSKQRMPSTNRPLCEICRQKIELWQKRRGFPPSTKSSGLTGHCGHPTHLAGTSPAS